MVRNQNNFGFLRLLFAFLVVLAHSAEMVDGNRSREILTQIFGTMSFGEVGVDGFFLISGYLITKSFDRSTSWFEYISKRILRVYPGYIVAFLFCALVLGPQVGGQFSIDFFVKNFQRLALLCFPIMRGVFAGTAVPSLNGSMWTIAYEFRCYLLVLACGLAGPTSRRILVLCLTAAALAISAAHVAFDDVITGQLVLICGEPAKNIRFMGVFGCGSLFYLFRDWIRYDGRVAAIAGAALIMAMPFPPIAEAAFAILGGYVLFWFAFEFRSGTLAAVGQDIDLSYGVYLYAWPVQNTLIWLRPGIEPWAVFLATSVIVTFFAFLSWSLVEKYFIGLKTAITRSNSESLRPAEV